MPPKKVRPHYCNLASCVHHHPAKRLCTIGLRRVAGGCPEYRPRQKEPVPVCRRMGCVHHYWEDWRGRCSLGLGMAKGQKDCPRYEKKPGPDGRPCFRISCVHNFGPMVRVEAQEGPPGARAWVDLSARGRTGPGGPL